MLILVEIRCKMPATNNEATKRFEMSTYIEYRKWRFNYGYQRNFCERKTPIDENKLIWKKLPKQAKKEPVNLMKIFKPKNYNLLLLLTSGMYDVS